MAIQEEGVLWYQDGQTYFKVKSSYKHAHLGPTSLPGMQHFPGVQASVRSQAGETANILTTHLFQRLPKIIQRWPESWQQEHGCWTVVRDMIPACAAIKVLIGHCKDHRDLQCCGDADSLFVNDTTRFVLLTAQKHHLVGSYLFWANKHGRMVRSGKAYGRDQDLGTRVQAHVKGSRLTTADQQKSHFYRMYPDVQKYQDVVDKGGKPWGCFQDLTAYVGFAFDKRQCEALQKDVTEGGLLPWSKASLQVAGKCPVGADLAEKQLHVISYVFELVDELMIEPRFDVSESGGMEAFMMGKGPAGCKV